MIMSDETQKKGFWSKLKRGLTMTHTEIIERVGLDAKKAAVPIKNGMRNHGLLTFDSPWLTENRAIDRHRSTSRLFG